MTADPRQMTDRPSVRDRAQSISDTLDELERALSEHRSCLEPVLRPNLPYPPGPEDGMAKVAPAEEASWLADWLTATVTRIAQIAAGVNHLTERVDL